MALFVSNFTNKIDRKGRVSVPASFRQILAAKGSDTVVLYPHPKHDAIEGSGMDWLEDYAVRLDQLPEYSDERDVLRTLLGQVSQIAADNEGRIIIPEDLARHAGFGETAMFIGAGNKFEIWEPARYAAHLAEQRTRMHDRSLTLPPRIHAQGTAS